MDFLHNIIAASYQEELISRTKKIDQLWKFDCFLHWYSVHLKDIQHYYLIDENDNFWLDRELCINAGLRIKRLTTKFIDIDNNKQLEFVLLEKFSIELLIKGENAKIYKIIWQIIFDNKRQGAGRKRYISPDGSIFNIQKKIESIKDEGLFKTNKKEE